MRGPPELPMRTLSPCLALLALSACHPSDGDASAVRVHTEPCRRDPAFDCGTLDLPMDPADPDGERFEMSFAVRPADGPDRLGPLVIVDGGPGQPGTASIDDLTWIDPALSHRFDLVYLDLRGTKGSGGLFCREATDAWYRVGQRVADGDDEVRVAAAAALFAADCATESGWSLDRIAALRTDRAAADLEALRLALGGEPLTLYGLSYGTQVVQEYVTTYPDHVRAMVLDGVVDLTLRDLDYATALSRAVNEVLDRALIACEADPACAPEELDAAYDAVAARLDGEAATVVSPMPDGGLRTRTFTRAHLDTVTALALDDPWGRGSLLRAVLAAARRDDFVPLRRLLDLSAGLEPLTERYWGYQYSDAVYYAVTCNDYGSVEGGVEAWMARGAQERQTGLRSTSAQYGDLPCATWPTAQIEGPRPGPFVTRAPVMVVSASGDVATPFEMGGAVAEGLRAAGHPPTTIDVDGGHHVVWGDSTCADPVITHFLLDPASERLPVHLDCDGGWVRGFTPLGPEETAGLDALDAAVAFVTELEAIPWLPWVGDQGCDLGGAVTFTGEHGITLQGCRFFEDLVVDGEGTVDYWTGDLTMSLTLSGAHAVTVTYARDSEGSRVEVEAPTSASWSSPPRGPPGKLPRRMEWAAELRD